MRWGERLRQLIGGDGQPTQQEVAEKMGITRSFVSTQMGRMFPPGPKVVTNFAEALGITTAELLHDVEDEYDSLRESPRKEIHRQEPRAVRRKHG